MRRILSTICIVLLGTVNILDTVKYSRTKAKRFERFHGLLAKLSMSSMRNYLHVVYWKMIWFICILKPMQLASIFDQIFMNIDIFHHYYRNNSNESFQTNTLFRFSVSCLVFFVFRSSLVFIFKTKNYYTHECVLYKRVQYIYLILNCSGFQS